MRSVRSGTESTRSTKRKKRPGINTAVTPAQIFAQNLSDAVLDADGTIFYYYYYIGHRADITPCRD